MSIHRPAHEDRTVLSLTQDEVEQARTFNDRVHAARMTAGPGGHTIALVSPRGDTLPLPGELSNLFGQMLDVVSRGGTVTVGSIPTEVTTTTAAKMLGISRPTLMKMVREGVLPAHKRGSHTRLLSKDVLAHRESRTLEQSRAFDALRDLEDELGIDA